MTDGEQSQWWKVLAILMCGMTAMTLIAVFVLRAEGQKTREAMRKGIEDASLAPDPKEAVSLIVDVLSEGFGKNSRQNNKGEGDLSDEKEGATRGPDVSRGERHANATEMIEGLHALGNEVLRNMDDIGQEVFEVNDTQEREIGAEAHRLLLQDAGAKLQSTGEACARVAKAGVPFVERVVRRDIPYSFAVIDSEEVNAFALPGGFVYVTTGLLEFIDTDRELEFVVGHEVGHIDLKHCIRNYTYAFRARGLGGSLAAAVASQAYRQYAVSFSEHQEFDADKYALTRMLENGASVDEALAFSARLIDYDKAQGGNLSESTGASVAGAMLFALEKHFRTHPPSQDRLERLQQFVKRRPSNSGFRPQ